VRLPLVGEFVMVAPESGGGRWTRLKVRKRDLRCDGEVMFWVSHQATPLGRANHSLCWRWPTSIDSRRPSPGGRR
jgi:hypothetical protein